MTARHRLHDRRASETFAFDCDRLRYTATVSRFDDGRPAELFIQSHKAGSHVDHASKDAAILCSLALQHGTPIETIRGALQRDQEGKAITPVAVAIDAMVERL